MAHWPSCGADSHPLNKTGEIRREIRREKEEVQSKMEEEGTEKRGRRAEPKGGEREEDAHDDLC